MVTTITPTIVNLSTQVVVAPTPSQLQQSGAAVVAGATTLAASAYQYCGTLSAVQALLVNPVAITSLTWASGVVTATVPAQTIAVAQTFNVTITGATPAGYNGTFEATVVSSTTFTYPLSTNPGAETVPGTYTLPTVSYLNDFATTFFAQGSSVGLYVLELGTQTGSGGALTALTTWITNNTGVFYALATPAEWSLGTLNTIASNYSSPSGKLYFFPTVTLISITTFLNNKAVLTTVPSPTQASTEYQSAALFYQWLSNSPSAATPAAPMAYRYVYGVTPWTQFGNGANINTVLTDYGNLILTGAEGGISTACIFKGTTMDGQQAMFWYAVDWFQIQIKQQFAAAIINGSNQNPPLQYNQTGINALLAVGQGICNAGISFGLALSATITATPFITYTTANPSNYDAGIYGGFVLTVTPQLGFLTISVQLDALQFV